jgi:hypothetical protein
MLLKGSEHGQRDDPLEHGDEDEGESHRGEDDQHQVGNAHSTPPSFCGLSMMYMVWISPTIFLTRERRPL